ncbi:MAG TPA: polyphosphate kinase 1 [Planctomycetota bacterium]|nr:polyphosphate kinase 1 [Planctomycetota bacterium]
MSVSMAESELFLNRELSWLEFNARVLEEARDPRRPLLERLKFLAIFSSNADEFFMIRVAGLQQRDPNEVSSSESGDRMTTAQILSGISTRTHQLVADQYRLLREEVLPGLQKEGLQLLRAGDVTGRDAERLDHHFARDIQPVLTPMAIDPAHPFPHIQNRQLYIATMLRAKGQNRLRAPKICLGIVPVPGLLSRFVRVPPEGAGDAFVTLEDLIARHLETLFGGFEAKEWTVFRLTRDQDFELSEQDSEDLVKQIQSELAKRRRGQEVRLEIGMGATDRLKEALFRQFNLQTDDIYEVDGPLNLAAFWSWVALPGYAPLREPARTPQVSERVHRHKGDLFSLIRSGDVLLHHPYESFETVVEFIEQAAADPNVLALKQTLYRAGRNSPIVTALARAAERDKQVTVLIELQARFDEEANIEWARTLERAGAHVVYGLPGLKTHCKVSTVVRRDPDRLRRYVHLSSGNYNPTTARIYTDVSLMTCDEVLGEDAAALFDMMTGYVQPVRWNKMRVAPHGLREWVIETIDRERAHCLAGRPARIVAKLNALVDSDVIRALYRASRAGVPIDLIVRGICCLRPGLAGTSENIRVRSIVGRYLEHSRIFYFANGGANDVYVSSADWMPRNFDRRVEIVFPIEDERLKTRFIDEVLASALLDDFNVRVLRSDGSYERLNGTFNAHEVLEKLASGAGRTFSLPSREARPVQPVSPSPAPAPATPAVS